MPPLSTVVSTHGRSPRWSAPLQGETTPLEIRPITFFRGEPKEGTWQIVTGSFSRSTQIRRLDDLLSITFAAFTSAFAATVAARLLRASSAWWPERVAFKTPAVAKALSQSPVEAAKARWRVRALAEATFAERLLQSATDTEGLPMPPADGDDDEPR
jgi:hypothetical protein